MTLNTIIKRISTIALAHKQVKSFKKGLAQDFFTDHTTLYPAVFLQDNDGGISIGTSTATFNFKILIVDLVHVSEDTKNNEQDVHSDTVSVALDLFAQFNHPSYTDWKISKDNSIQLMVEEDPDMFAGCSVDFSISVPYKQNVCEVPTTITTYTAPSGARVRITLDRDIVTGELTILLTQYPTDSENNTATEQDITITDFLKGIVMTTPTGEQARMTFHKNATGELEFILTEL